jgi:hypothetical protein
MQSAFLPTTGVESLDQVYLLPIMNSYDFCSSKSTHLPDLEVARNRFRTTADSHEGSGRNVLLSIKPFEGTHRLED